MKNKNSAAKPARTERQKCAQFSVRLQPSDVCSVADSVTWLQPRPNSPRACPSSARTCPAPTRSPRSPARRSTSPTCNFPGMLHAAVLRSPHPHARIVSIDMSAAEAMPGVKAVVTGADTAKRKWGAFRPDLYPLAIGKVRYVGDEVAAVAAIDPATARAAVDRISRPLRSPARRALARPGARPRRASRA